MIISFSPQLQLAEKEKEISGLTSYWENLSREKVLNNVLEKFHTTLNDNTAF